jgi:hypothetical protein
MDVSLKFSSCVETKLGQYGYDLEPLRIDLIEYFESNGRKRPKYIGKDAPFTRPNTITDSEVHHLHMYIEGVSCTKKWKEQRTTNSYLVYTFGDMNEEAYYVIGFIHDYAHEKCKLPEGHPLLTGFKIAADDFRNKN